MSHLDILAAAICDHLLHVLRLDDDRHTLLRLADRKFGRIETIVLHRNPVEIYVKTVGKLADRHADTAGTEVVRFLYEPCHLRTAEKPLKLSLLRRVTLLNLASACLERLLCMFLR